MDPFNFQKMFRNMQPTHTFSPDYLKDIKWMVDQYKQVLDDDFWNSIHGMGRQKKQVYNSIPLETWENDTYLFLSAFVPGLVDVNHVKLSFLSDKRVLIKAKPNRPQPATSTKMIESDFHDGILEREMDFPYPVHKDNYHVTVDNSIATFIFRKREANKKEESIPVDF
ncbi:hypothetical protein [Radiobacillus deserti]|uniref:Hsp20/alpha crystallin family protein n=1 Tax=Radiobacillus deserti TaxID=2594883 RepID=A0A516KED5_9BACI|nr:hypothetical protein [Radiobacillus deserti]QDP39773.1 hypothetical protein FN924_06065 [Radiobacillus deserti]